MKSIRFVQRDWMPAGTLLAAMALGFLPEARGQSIFTNHPPVPLPRRSSIILIVGEGLGYGDLSCCGQTKFQTPNLDRLAAGGIRFTSYYAGNAAGSSSHAALLLGRDPGHWQQRADVDVPLAADDVTVAQVLQRSGYHTGLIGEWDLGGDGTAGAPWNKGFDEFAGYFDPNDAKNYYADYVWRHDSLTHLHGRVVVYANTDGRKGQYLPDLFTTMALNFVKINLPDRHNHYRPFFLLLNYKIPGAGNGPVPTDAPYSAEPWPQPQKDKAAMMTRLDADIGQLWQQLKALNVESNTVIFFTSDGGPQTSGGVAPKFFLSAGPFRGLGGDPYEGGLRVPMIAHWPDKISAGRISDFPWAAWDFLPTATDIALIQSPTNIDGISVWPTLLGRTQTNRHEFFHWQLRGRNVWHTVRLGDWKAVQPKAGAPLELYNLKTDPGETDNVADQHPDVIRKFQDILKNSR